MDEKKNTINYEKKNTINYDIIIIGFGISGIAMAKESIKRKKKILILEKETNGGGVWFTCHKNCELQSHKTFYEYTEEETMTKSISNYPNKREVLKYLDNIIKKYKLNNYVIYNYNVKTLEKYNNEYLINKKYKSKFVAICCGVNNNIKKIDTLNDYEGELHYSKYLKKYSFDNMIYDSNKIINKSKKNNYTINQNKTILVIGNGASACDVIKNIDNINPNLKIICLYKKDKYFIDKYIFGLPISIFLNEIVLLFFNKIHLTFYRIIVKLVNIIFFKNALNIPNEKMNSNNLIGSNIINKKIKNGSLSYINDTIEFCYKKNIICSKNIFLNIDIIFCCNGYNNTFSFMNYDIPKNRYLGIFDTNFKNIGFIGYNPSYNWPKISEKQSMIFLDYIEGKMNINKYYEKKIKDKYDFTYNLYDYLKL